jgi:hypothetical protein
MAKRINTDLGINVNLTDAPDIKTLAVANLPAPTGKNNFELLSDALGQFNPKIQELVKKEVQRENLETEVLGANTVNQMTLDDARKAHQEGFPSIYNGWARVGAYKQYAINSNEEFSSTMKKRYYENRNNPQYNWQNDYAELSQFYLKDKQQDPFFQSAFQKESVDTQKWITEQEFTFQIENLKTRVQQDTMYQLRVLPDKTLDTLNANFRETIPVETSGKDYEQRKQDYIAKNYVNLWNEQFENIKKNLNPVLSKVDFDGLVVDQAEAHLKSGGDYISLYVDKLIKPRPDGTPAILDNPKYNDKVINIVSKANESLKTLQFYEGLKSGNTSLVSNEDFKKYSGALFDNLVSKHRANGESQGQAIQNAATTLAPHLSKSRPIPQIKEILNRPIGTTVTPDNRSALNLALILDNVGALPTYFDGAENSKDAFKWQLATMFYRNGDDVNTVIKKIGNFEQAPKTSSLTDAEKDAISSEFGNLKTIHNQSLAFGIAQYIKSTDPNNPKLEKTTSQYINKYYFKDDGGKYISKSKLKMLDITEDEYKPLKEEATLYLKETIDSIKKEGSVSRSALETLKQDNKLKGFGSVIQKQLRDDLTNIEGTNFKAGDYDFIIDPERRKIRFTSNNDVGYFEPIIIDTKDGQRIELEFDYDTIFKRYKGKQDIDKRIKQSKLNQKIETINKYNATYQEFIKVSP